MKDKLTQAPRLKSRSRHSIGDSQLDICAGLRVHVGGGPPDPHSHNRKLNDEEGRACVNA